MHAQCKLPEHQTVICNVGISKFVSNQNQGIKISHRSSIRIMLVVTRVMITMWILGKKDKSEIILLSHWLKCWGRLQSIASSLRFRNLHLRFQLLCFHDHCTRVTLSGLGIDCNERSSVPTGWSGVAGASKAVLLRSAVEMCFHPVICSQAWCLTVCVAPESQGKSPTICKLKCWWVSSVTYNISYVFEVDKDLGHPCFYVSIWDASAAF